MPVVDWGEDTRQEVRVPRVVQQVPLAEEGTNTPTSSAPSSAETAPGELPPSFVWVASEDAAEWNSLLIYARTQRGAQWDMGTGVYVLRH